MPIVKEYIDEGCRIYIHDDYIVKTEEEVNKILDDLSKLYARQLLARKLKQESA